MGNLLNEFRNKGVLRGSILLFRPDIALTLVRRCREEAVEVLGIDAFRLDGSTIQPDMAQSVDFTSISARNKRGDRWDEAEKFLSARLTSELFFEVVIDE